jgi:fimbrial chaperone protein
MKMRVLAGALIVGALFSVIGVESAQAFRVEPMSYTLAATGSEARHTLRVHNTQTAPVAIEVVVQRRSMDETGRMKHAPAADDFLVFPPQTLVQPGASQAIRVQYIGEPELDATRVYTIAVQQVPLQDTEDGTAAVEVVFRFGTAAYVVPRGARPDVRVTSVETPADGRLVAVTLENAGNGHANLRDFDWLLIDRDGDEHELDPETLETVLGNPIIYPDHRRRIDLPVPGAVQTDRVRIEVQPRG